MGPTLCNLPETEKHQSQHMDLRHVNIVSHRNTSGTLHYCTLFKTERREVPKNEMPIVWGMVGFCFQILQRNSGKRTKTQTKTPTFQQHAKWFSPFDRLLQWSTWVLKAQKRAARYKMHWKRDGGCGFSSWLRAKGVGEGTPGCCSVRIFLYKPVRSQKAPVLQWFYQRLKIKTRKINTLSNNKRIDTFSPLNKSASSR